VFESIIVAFALLPSFLCASRPVISAIALWLWRSAPHPVLGFPTGLYPVGCEGRIHYIFVIKNMRQNSYLIQKMPMLSISEWSENRQIHMPLLSTSA